MTKRIIQALQEQLSTVQSVKRSSTQPEKGIIFNHHDADLVIYTWMGARIYVYLITKPIKVKRP